MKNRADYKLAKLLKEIGYDDETLFNINEHDVLSGNGFLINWNQYPIKFSAPTLTEVCDWLYEKFKIFIIPDYYRATCYNHNKFTCAALDLNKEAYDGDMIYITKEKYETKYDAIYETLLHVIDYIFIHNLNTEKEATNSTTTNSVNNEDNNLVLSFSKNNAKII